VGAHHGPNVHSGVNDLKAYEQWLIMRREESLKLQAQFELDENQDDELYEWAVAHAAVFGECLANFRAANSPKKPRGSVMKNKLLDIAVVLVGILAIFAGIFAWYADDLFKELSAPLAIFCGIGCLLMSVPNLKKSQKQNK
jgi:hypothetical protein